MDSIRAAILARCRDLETEILVRQAVLTELRGLLGDIRDLPAVARDIVVASGPVAPPTPVAFSPPLPPPPAVEGNGKPAGPPKKPGPPSRWPNRREGAAHYLAENGPQTLTGLVLKCPLPDTDRAHLRQDPWFEVAAGKVSLTQDGWAFVRGEIPTPAATPQDEED